MTTQAALTTQKIALVTGGNRGLGRSAALALAENGVDIVLTYRSDADEAAEVVDAITRSGHEAVALRLDTTQFVEFERFAADLRSVLAERWSRTDVDFLLNNAGSATPTPLGQTTAESIDLMFNVHFKGVVLLTQTLAPLMADGGRILNLSTGLTRFYAEGLSVYASMKGAVEVYTRYLAKELGGRGISVNAIAPGATATDFGGGAVRDNENMRAGHRSGNRSRAGR